MGCKSFYKARAALVFAQRADYWLSQVFGATGHLGRSVVNAALSHGDLVTAVGRTCSDSIDAMHRWLSTPRSPLSSSSPRTTYSDSNYLPLLCDVRLRKTVDTAIQASISHWTRIDIVANCSGYGIIGACEDQDEFEIRNQFETNFWGTLNIIQLSLPYFRERYTDTGEGGRYLIFSSTSGALGVPGLGPFCATKYAVEGLIESMLYEVDAFNIKATLVEPGHVRKDEPGTSTTLPTFGHFSITPASEPYAGATAPAGHAKRMVQWLGERQPTSAVKVAELVWQLGHCSFPPLRLLLGSFAVESVRDRLRCVIEEIEDWKFLSFGEDAATGNNAKADKSGGEEDGEEKEERDIKMEDGDGEGEDASN